MKKLIVVAAAALASAGCTSLFEGSYQSIAVESNPPHAVCSFFDHREVKFAEVVAGDTTYNVRRSRMPITVVCHKKGFKDATLELTPVANTGNMIAGLFTDIIMTTHYNYPESISVELEKM